MSFASEFAWVCSSCGIKSNPERPLPLFQVGPRVLCSRCMELDKICLTTTTDCLGAPPDTIVGPLFLEHVMAVPTQSILQFPNFLETVKTQLMLRAKDRTYHQSGNALVQMNLQLTPLESPHYLVSLSGTMVWSHKWHVHVSQLEPPRELVATMPTPSSTPSEKEPEEKTSKDSVVGKYPDVGGDSQMNRFRKLTATLNS
ncbi:hypothetical protein ACFYKX_10370 [Cytobacillus sp. FJAT-54145]|uniref:Uncharacterized protein n=1 Tax=Cytobacillus spartinae TaxID=3299023 RepID=A0ABW6KA36_9BACI